MDSFLQDLRHSIRMLVKHPALTITCVVTLSLGIGLTATMFSIINGSFWEPLPFEDSKRILFLMRNNLSEDAERMPVSIHDFTDWRREQTSFEDLAGWYDGTVNLNNEGDTPIRYDGSFITPSAFTLVRVQPLMGRIFTEEEMSPGTPAVIMIGYDVWQTRFGGDPEIIGKTVRANALTSTIIGVMPEGYVFPDGQDVWLPQRQDPAQITRNEGYQLTVIGRLRDGVTIGQARAEFDRIAANLAAEYPDTNEGVGAGIFPVSRLMLNDEARIAIFLILAGTLAVLLIACFNVANILLARATKRVREMAMRTSLGASRVRLIRQMLIEAFGLAIPGSALGLLLGHIGITLFGSIAARTDPPWWFRFEIDLNVVLYVLGLMLLTTLFSGILPAIQASRSNISEVLKDESRGASGLRMSRFSKALVIAEIAFSLGLLFTAGLMTKSVLNLKDFDFGIESDNVLTARLGLFEADYPSIESRSQFWQELHQRLNEMPGVVSASLTPNLPLRGADGGSFVFEGVEYPPDSDLPFTSLKLVTPDYFTSFGIDILQGRDFTDADIAGGLVVAVVNQSFADRWSPGESPLGKRARGSDAGPDEPWYTIVGVVGDEWTDNENNTPEVAYGCLYQADAQFISIVTRTNGNALALAPDVRNTVMSIDPNMPIYWVMTMDEVIYDATWVYSMFGGLLIITGLFALFLASIGLYGVMSFSVSRRTREIGIRMALGAQPTALVQMILRQGSAQLGIGMLIGIGLAWVFAQGLKMLMFGVVPADPLVITTIVLTLGTTGILASFIPARRATQIDPVTALRYE